ncbi:hypothetical protein [Blastococcus sp. Marseille-P5729]|uniref:hypothetical protein n=1 Tax=Blastococcus sp. Marseille-P5729 TaxID=2086582 RepID=UPI00131AC406|nr:hypothetical protein [Blastococcus sp. Marseille-P5729]
MIVGDVEFNKGALDKVLRDVTKKLPSEVSVRAGASEDEILRKLERELTSAGVKVDRSALRAEARRIAREQSKS